MYSDVWFALKQKERELEANPYWKQDTTMSLEREQFRSAPLHKPMIPRERPSTPEKRGFQARPMPPPPKGASCGADFLCSGCTDDGSHCLIRVSSSFCVRVFMCCNTFQGSLPG